MTSPTEASLEAQDAASARPQPKSLSDLFFSFTFLALQGFGGVLAVVQRELVEKKRWLSAEEFVESWAVAQIMPGPNVVNLALMVGDRYFGRRGALAAMAGMLLFPLLLVLALAVLYAHFAAHPAVAGALRGMGAVSAGLIAGTGLKLARTLRAHPLGPWGCGLLVAATFVAMVWLHWPLIGLLPTLGGLACVLTWRKLPQTPEESATKVLP